MTEQTSLFSAKELRTVRYLTRQPHLEISKDALQDWKQRVFQYQQQVSVCTSVQQGTLFDLMPTAGDIAETMNPFQLPQQNIEFWRWKVEDVGVAALYFVIDYTLPILLYVGETVKSNQRWKGEHDCKRYILNYVSSHRSHALAVAVGIAFCSWAPEQTRPRQQLESALIDRWRSPFNKENWEFWATPFIGGK
jgi:hypothetical protein